MDDADLKRAKRLLSDGADLTIHDLAFVLDCSLGFLYKQIRLGQLHAIRVGRRQYRVPNREARRFLCLCGRRGL